MGRELTHTLTTGTAHRRTDHREGILAKTIEEQTAKLPSDTFLWAATRSIAASLALKIMGRDKDALFVGQWGTIRIEPRTCSKANEGIPTLYSQHEQKHLLYDGVIVVIVIVLKLLGLF